MGLNSNQEVGLATLFGLAFILFLFMIFLAAMNDLEETDGQDDDDRDRAPSILRVFED